MKGILLYAGFHETTEYFADIIAKKLSIEKIHAASCSPETLKEYDYVVLGSAVQKFRLHPAVEKFINQSEEILSTKKLFLFISAYNPMIISTLEKHLPQHVLQNIVFSMVLGGKIDWNKLSLKEKLLITIIEFTKRVRIRHFNTVTDKRIEKFIQKVQGMIAL